MAYVTTYTADGVADIKELMRLMVNDLTGNGTPTKGTVANHMKLIYPTDLDFTSSADWANDILIILESTTNIDPFATPTAAAGDPPASTIGTDPWRIAFHTSRWRAVSTGIINKGSASPTIEQVIDDTKTDINSLAIYLGTPATLGVSADGIPQIGWKTSTVQKLPYLLGVVKDSDPPIIEKFEYEYSKTYKGRDLVEPLGNTGAEWTNTFDPTQIETKNRKQDQVYKKPAPTNESPTKWDGPDVTDPNQLFINRYVSVGPKSTTPFAGMPIDSKYGQPISYRIVVTDHGLFIGTWGPDPEENGKDFSWLLVQRPVDKKTGIVRGLNTLNGLPYTGTEVDADGDLIPKGNRPLFCVNSVNGKYWKFIVREHDNAVPSARKDATINTPDSGAVINPYQQQSLTENGEYVITFLNNLNTSRFKYSDELDMVGTVSSDVVGGGSQINVNVYSEADRRAYHALWSSGSFGTKMRIMVVADIPTPNQPWVPPPEPPEPPPEEPPPEEPPPEEPPAE